MAQWVKNLTAVAHVTAEVQVRSPAQHSGLRIRHCHSCGVGQQLRLQIQSLARELLYVMGVAIKKEKKKGQERKESKLRDQGASLQRVATEDC